MFIFLPLTAGGPGLKHIVWPIEWTSVMAESQPQWWFLPWLLHIPTVIVLVSLGWYHWWTGPNLGPGLAGLSSQVCWRFSLQSCEGPPSPTGRRVARFRAWQGSIITWGFSHDSPCYWVIRDVDSHLWGSPCRRVLTSCGTFMIKSWPKVSLVASRTNKATAATARKHPSHPVAILSSSFGR